MAALRLGVALLALTTVALGDEDAVLLQARPKASAELSEGMAATKAGIVEKTEHLAEAMKSLEDESEAALKKDYEDVVEMYEADVEKDLNADTKHASLAEGGEGLAAAKAGILAKTHDLAQAMESLNSEDLASMRKDFEDVFAMYKEDVEKDFKTHAGIEKHASLAHSSEGLAAMKSKVISTTEQFAKAMESLNTEDKGALKTDFKDVFKLFKDDLRKITGSDAEEEDGDPEKKACYKKCSKQIKFTEMKAMAKCIKCCTKGGNDCVKEAKGAGDGGAKRSDGEGEEEPPTEDKEEEQEVKKHD